MLDRVYEVPFGETAWDGALTAVCDFIGAESGDLNFFDPVSLAYQRWEPARIDSATIVRYAADFVSDMRNVHPRMPHVAGLQENQVVADSDLWTATARSRMPYFASIMLPGGMHDCLFGAVRAGGNDGKLIVLGSFFDRKAGIPQQALRNRLRMLLPHLRRACAAEEKLQVLRRENALLTEALDQIADAVAMVDGAGRVVRSNRAAAASFSKPFGISLARDGHIRLPTTDARAALARGLAQCASPILWVPSATVGPPAQIVVPRLQGQPLILTLQPLPKELAGAYGAVALLFINDLQAKAAKLGSALLTGFGLTLPEAELAQALFDGKRIDEYANERGVSINTARSQLQAIFAKTDTSRQADLVRLLKSMRTFA